MTQPFDLDALQAAAEAARGWKWETVQGDQFGHFEEGSFYDIGTVDADQYAVGDESHNETVLNFIAAANPAVVSALIARLKKAEARLDWIEAQINEYGAIHLHDGSKPYGHGLGLRPGSIRRTLREAIDQCIAAPSDSGREG